MASKEDPADKQLRPWTVLLYMAAAKNDVTEQAAIADIIELQGVDTRDKVHVVVQIERQWPGYPERYRILKDGNLPKEVACRASSIQGNTGNPEPLREFLAWAREYAPAKHSLLVLWGHAYGLGFGRDHDDPLTMEELSTALAGGPKLDLLGANACAMSYAEAAYELRNAAHFMVAPETTMPLQGWPYTEILKKIVSEPTIEPHALGTEIVNGYMKSFGGKNVALTLLDLSKAEGLKPRLDDLTYALTEAGEDEEVASKVAAAFLDTAHGDVRPLIDLDDLCERLAADVGDEMVTLRANAMRALLKGDGLVVKHEADPEFEGLHGLGIFAPAVTGAADLTRLDLSEKQYETLALVNGAKGAKGPKASWTKLVYDDLRVSLDPLNKEIAGFVRRMGAASREERTGAAQLLVGVYRAFAKLDATATAVKARVMHIVEDREFDPGYASKAHTGAANGNGNGKHYLRLLPRRWYGEVAPGLVPILPPAVEATGGNGDDSKEARRRGELIAALRQLEDDLGRAERITRRVVTHASLGLGDERDLKSGGGLGEDRDPKPSGALGEDRDPKPSGALGPMSSFFGGVDDEYGASNGAKVLNLYTQIATVWQQLEEAVGRLESAALANRISATASTESECEQATEEIKGAFRELDEALASAIETSSSVLQHPTYGLGPGGEWIFAGRTRQHLANAGGLGPRVLRLL
jgi:hypothetical protein